MIFAARCSAVLPCDRVGPGDAGKPSIAYLNRGNALDDNGQVDLAIQDCDQALKLDSNDAFACYNRGLSKQKTGEKSGGKADIAKAKQLNSKVDEQ
jgi:Flp pilus assembly protein TadD